MQLLPLLAFAIYFVVVSFGYPGPHEITYAENIGDRAGNHDLNPGSCCPTNISYFYLWNKRKLDVNFF